MQSGATGAWSSSVCLAECALSIRDWRAESTEMQNISKRAEAHVMPRVWSNDSSVSIKVAGLLDGRATKIVLFIQ